MDQDKVDEKVMTLVHFARKARKLVTGYDAVRRSIESRNAFVALTANDLEKGRKRSIRFLCEQMKIPMFSFSQKQRIGEALDIRDVGILAIEDRNLAAGIRKYLDQ